MKRDIEKDFIKWAQNKNRMPLIIRGARQVGKSYIVENCLKNYFKNIIVCNFEFTPELKNCFDTLDPITIVNKIQLLLNVEITKNSLLFLDEIQECPQAIMSLRYFKEKLPEQAVICAGSLLEFAMNNENFSMPVGRVSFIYVQPLSFGEFLSAVGQDKLRQHLKKISLDNPLEEMFHKKLIELLKIYLVTGGMPAVVQEYINTKNINSVLKIQNYLLTTYRNDFGKYSKISKRQHLEKVMNFVPRFIGQRVKYSTIDSDVRSEYLKEAIYLLSLAGIIKQIFSTAASGLPLQSEINDSKFKLNFLDVGLMQNVAGLSEEIVNRDIMQINNGAVAEQFVGQEILAYSDPNRENNLYFWGREKKGSMAEVDFVTTYNANIIPVEVKSGTTGSLKSLKLFMEEKKAKIALRFCMQELSFYDGILSIPLYMVSETDRLLSLFKFF
ncbi:MAG: ATP-binding protein [Elusimicrobia bacterium]|nr:ATP-binding protein [Elusimicrobiota bacterium]